MSDISAHLPYLLEQALNSERILEIGTRGGASTFVFLMSRAECQRGLVISIDINALCEQEVKEKFGTLVQNWEFVCGNSTNSATINFMKIKVPFDLIFIDSSHEAEQTIIELEEYSKMIRPNGKIILHDTELEEGVRNPILNFVKRYPEFQIERAVDYSHGLMTLVCNIK